MSYMVERKYKYSRCEAPLTREQVKCSYSANYCSDWCKKAADRAYDAYVDPSGFYQRKAEVNDPTD